MLLRAFSDNKREEVPPMSINTFRARAFANGFHQTFNKHMRQDVLGRDAEEGTEETPPDPYSPARLPLWGTDEW